MFLITPNTSLTGAKMLTEKSLDIPKKIAGFIDLRLVKNKNLPGWEERKDPQQSEGK